MSFDSIRQGDGKAFNDLDSWVASLLASRDIDFPKFKETLRALASATSPASSLRAILVIRHLLFLLEDGRTVFSDCKRQVSSAVGDVVIVERIVDSEDGLLKIHAKIRAAAAPSDPDAFHEFLDGPSIVIYTHPLVIHQEPPQSGVPIPIIGVDRALLLSIYRNKQQIADNIHASWTAVREAEHARSLRMMKRDMQVNRIVSRKIGTSGKRASNRVDHPYRGAVLQILPRLLREHGGQTVLAMIRDSLPEVIARGFRGLMLAPVDRQSVHTYLDETRSGTLTAHFNNHGYWCSGEVGIEPGLGTDDDFARLVAAAASAGMSYMQDCTFGTLGYPAQDERFASSSIESSTTRLVFGSEPVDVWDTRYFLRAPEVLDDGQLEDGASSELYAASLTQLHVGGFFGLPRPNIYDVDVLKAIMARSLWLIENFGVSSFRIDMSKHLGVLPLRSIIKQLRSAVHRRSISRGQPAAEFVALLEHWSIEYRDIRFAMDSLGNLGDHVYLYDFPLAHALQRILVRGEGFHVIVSDLMKERSRWQVNLNQLIPTFIDHDSHFRPIYDGGQLTSAMVVVGYAMALMLSANGPCVYVGYEDERLGVPDLDNFHGYTEQHSRKTKDFLFSKDDPRTPANPIASLFEVVHGIGVLEHGDAGEIVVRGGGDWLVISRTYFDRRTVSRREIRAHFCRGQLEHEVSDPWEDELFLYNNGMTVRLAVSG